MNSNTIDDLEERLRVACHAAVPHLLDDADETHGSEDDLAPLRIRLVPTAGNRRPGFGRARIMSGIAAALLLVAAAAAIRIHDDSSAHVDAPGQPDETIQSSVTSPNPTTETSGGAASSPVGKWVAVPGPLLDARWQNLSIGTSTGWFVWGGITRENQSGLNDGAYLDSQTAVWRVVPPAPITASTAAPAGVWTDAEFIVLVADTPAPQMAAFDPVAFTWRTIQIPADILAAWPRGDAGFHRGIVSFIDSQVVIFFPNDPEQGSPPEILMFDTRDSTWHFGATPPASMTSLTGPVTSSESQLFIVGGGQRNSDATCLGGWRLYSFDVPTNVWNEYGILRADWLPAMAAWDGERVVLAGGTECTSGRPVRMTMTFDPTTPSFTTRAEMPLDVPNVSGSAVTIGKRIAAIAPGGEPLVYDAAEDRWQVGPSFLTDATSADSTPVALGTVLGVWSAGISRDEGGGNSSCCYPTGEAFTYFADQFNPGTIVAGEGLYVVAAGDSPATIADKFKVTLEDLLNINEWTLVGDQVPEFPAVGTAIRIPPGSAEPDATTASS